MDDQRRPPNPDQALQRVDDATQRGSIPAHLEVLLAPSVHAPTRARAELATWLEQEAGFARLIHDACLLVSELVTNCIRHAQISQTQPLRLSASLRTASLRLQVHDNGTDGTVARRTPQRYRGGFGLDLVAQLSSTWGVERDGYGTTVWLELAAETPANA
jgi:serine/threonine-protein kinase RsbW